MVNPAPMAVDPVNAAPNTGPASKTRRQLSGDYHGN